jgi:hypothetical protein
MVSDGGIGVSKVRPGGLVPIVDGRPCSYCKMCCWVMVLLCCGVLFCGEVSVCVWMSVSVCLWLCV